MRSQHGEEAMCNSGLGMAPGPCQEDTPGARRVASARFPARARTARSHSIDGAVLVHPWSAHKLSTLRMNSR